MISPNPGRQIRVHMIRRHQRLLQMLVHHGAGRFAVERRPAGHQVIHRRAERINVGAEIDIHIAANLLGADVVGRAVRFARFASPRPLCHPSRASQTQVGQLRHALRRQQDVLRLHVAMNQAALMRVMQRIGDLDDDVQRLGLGETPAPRPPAAAA